MDPEVRADKQGACPKCGMALEPEDISTTADRTEYTCPMHPEIVRDAPGDCPICGMALEPRSVTVEAANPELVNMTRRFWAGVALTLPLLAVMVSDVLPSHPCSIFCMDLCLAGWNSLLPHRWFCGEVRRSLSAAGLPSSTAA